MLIICEFFLSISKVYKPFVEPRKQGVATIFVKLKSKPNVKWLLKVLCKLLFEKVSFFILFRRFSQYVFSTPYTRWLRVRSRISSSHTHISIACACTHTAKTLRYVCFYRNQCILDELSCSPFELGKKEQLKNATICNDQCAHCTHQAECNWKIKVLHQRMRRTTKRNELKKKKRYKWRAIQLTLIVCTCVWWFGDDSLALFNATRSSIFHRFSRRVDWWHLNVATWERINKSIFACSRTRLPIVC